MTVAIAELISPQEYLQLERGSLDKHEYIAGRMVKMAVASRDHNLIVGNVGFVLIGELRGRSGELYQNDMRVRIPATSVYTYPDVIVVKDEPIFDENEKDVLLNPTVIIEVLSPSTENYDRGEKFQSYRTIDSLQEYLMIAQDHYHIEHYVRQADDQWLFSEATTLSQTIQLPSIDCELPLADVYDKVQIALPSDPHQVNGHQG